MRFPCRTTGAVGLSTRIRPSSDSRRAVRAEGCARLIFQPRQRRYATLAGLHARGACAQDPVRRVDLDDPETTAVYVSTRSTMVLEHRNSAYVCSTLSECFISWTVASGPTSTMPAGLERHRQAVDRPNWRLAAALECSPRGVRAGSLRRHTWSAW